jgi:proton-translocating NAD(P)+ transhydrogenase subunit beta
MTALSGIGYLVAVCLFILGLRLLSSPRSARRGNLLSMIGMLVAVVTTLLDKQILDFRFIIAGIIIGSLIGVGLAVKVRMTAMPQMVALLNSFGGGASALVAISEFLRRGEEFVTVTEVAMALGVFIGMLTFTGSVIAYAKLEEMVRSTPVVFPGQTALNFSLIAACLGLCAVFAIVFPSHGLAILLVIFVLSSIAGVLLVIPIGGADMPVVIALLNSYSGIAAAAAGFIIDNYVLIVSGALVGASGVILSQIMCRAMNRSLTNVLFGAVGGEVARVGPAEARRVTRYSPLDAAAVLENSRLVIIVPGYGLAVAQAQYVLQDVAAALQKKGATVLYGIHPVAGRMPGHMNVLLAEASVPYDMLKDIDGINEEFRSCDAVLVVGANDVVNPAAREKGNSLSGMPILNVDQAQSVIFIKRSLSPGFAGVDNPLFYDTKTMMVFGDAKEVLRQVLDALKEGA